MRPPKMTDFEKPEEIQARFEQLTVLEADFEDAELETIRKSEALHAPLYEKRAEIIKTIPHFWPLVIDQAPLEIGNFIQPTDSKVLAECWDSFEVSRFELDDPKGSPRSFSLKFGFKENDYFEDKVLEKKFWFRQTRDWAGLVSEPVLIHWKKGQDLTGGLTDAAYKLGEARKKLGNDSADAAARKKETQLPEYKNLAKVMGESLESAISFFGMFSFVSGYRWVSAEESEKFVQEEKVRLEKLKRGEKVEDDDEDDDEDEPDYQEVEVFPGADEVASVIAEEMWPNAIKFFKASFEDDNDDDLSDIELSEGGGMDEDMSDSDDDEEKPVDIRALVGKGSKSDKPPPAKKQRKH